MKPKDLNLELIIMKTSKMHNVRISYDTKSFIYRRCWAFSDDSDSVSFKTECRIIKDDSCDISGRVIYRHLYQWCKKRGSNSPIIIEYEMDHFYPYSTHEFVRVKAYKEYMVKYSIGTDMIVVGNVDGIIITAQV